MLCYGPVMESTGRASPARSSGTYAKNLSDGTIASYLVGVSQFTASQPHGQELVEPPAPTRRCSSPITSPPIVGTAATRCKQLQAPYRRLEDEGEVSVSPMARMKPPAVPDRSSRSCPRAV